MARVTRHWDAADLEAAGQDIALPISMVRTQEEFQASDHWKYHAAAPLIQIEKFGESAPEPLPPSARPFQITPSTRNAIKPHATREMQQRQILPCLLVPADQQAPTAVQPRMRPFHHPAPRCEARFPLAGLGFFCTRARSGR
jgi:hypothetical protein